MKKMSMATMTAATLAWMLLGHTKENAQTPNTVEKLFPRNYAFSIEKDMEKILHAARAADGSLLFATMHGPGNSAIVDERGKVVYDHDASDEHPGGLEQHPVAYSNELFLRVKETYQDDWRILRVPTQANLESKVWVTGPGTNWWDLVQGNDDLFLGLGTINEPDYQQGIGVFDRKERKMIHWIPNNSADSPTMNPKTGDIYALVNGIPTLYPRTEQGWDAGKQLTSANGQPITERVTKAVFFPYHGTNNILFLKEQGVYGINVDLKNPKIMNLEGLGSNVQDFQPINELIAVRYFNGEIHPIYLPYQKRKPVFTR